jgi:PAS domain S-box-containing protein
VLAELAGDHCVDLPPPEAGRHLLCLGMVAMGATGGSARLVDSRGKSFEIIEFGSASSLPAPAAEAIDRRELAWLSTTRAVSEHFPGAATHDLGALASVPVELGGKSVGGLALWFDEERAFRPGDRCFVRALGTSLAREVDRASLHDARASEDRLLREVADRAAVAADNANLLLKLARSEEQLRVALEAGRLGAWDWDIPAQQVTWSAMLECIHGLQEGTFGGDFAAYQRDIHPEDRERVLSTIGRIVEERTDYYVSYRIIRPDGEVRWLEAYGKLLCDAAGTPQRLVGVCADITDRTKAEARLRETLLALRDADQRKDQFLAMLAHELRNPLGPLLNATYLLGKPELGEAATARARKILDRQVRHMARLLDDLLDVSRISRGKVELERETVDTSVLAREVVDDHLESFRAAGLALDLTVGAAPLVVHADRTRLAQVIGNLLSNALKFSERGQSVRVRVDLDESGRSVVLTVRDEGLGIEPALLGRMFKPFEQADTSLARHRGGLGLGLALVDGLVTLHGGRVSASSGGLGQGAELRVELPLHTGGLEVAESREPGRAQGSCAKVLVFEDNADAAESLRAILSGAGYRVCVESTGWHAIDAIRRFMPDLVLCDLGLPGRDGYAIAADIRSDGELSHLPLIAISGYGTIDDQARSRRAGFDLHLTKPVPPSLLVAELSRQATLHGGGAAASPR